MFSNPTLSAQIVSLLQSGTWSVLFHGVVLALGLILPLGVQNLFIFQQGAQQSRLWRAVPAIMTAALCDTLLITAAVAGVSVIVFSHIWIKTLLMAAGSLFLLYMALLTWHSTPRSSSPGTAAAYSTARQIGFAASVSLLNPHAILDTVGVIGTSSLQYTGGDRFAFTLACIIVSWVWFLSLALAGRLLGTVDSSGKALSLLNKGSALIIVAVAARMIYSVYRTWPY